MNARKVIVDWDTDGEDILPSEMYIPDNLDVEEVSDWLSEQTDFCLFSWRYAA